MSVAGRDAVFARTLENPKLDALGQVSGLASERRGARTQPRSTRTLQHVISVIAVGLGAYHLYAAIFGTPVALVHRAIHLGGLGLLGYLTLAVASGSRTRRAWLVASAVAALAAPLYLVVAFRDIITRVGAPGTADLAFAATAVLVTLDLARRLHGWALVATAGLFLGYGLFGALVPGLLAHRGYAPADILEFLYTTTEGIFGVPLQVSATYIVVFILFAAFLERSGLARLFHDLAFAVAGTTRGGVAKVAVLSSALMGTINGSALANVTTTGAITIPLMTRNGFAPHYAAAVEATASMGGQIMPPVMGVAAFIMAERLGMPYSRIALAAIVPALLYFLATGVQIHLHAARYRVQPANERVRRVAEILRSDGHLLLPILVLIGLMIAGRSPVFAAVTSIAVSLGLGVAAALAAAARARAGGRRVQFREVLDRRGASPTAIVRAIDAGIRNTIGVAIACAVVGNIVGIVTLTGAGLKLSTAIISLAGGMVMPTLVLTMLACFVLGMGLPTIPTYIITSTMAAPALITLGVDRLAADFFVMYFGVLANLTPPVALAAYAAAGLARASPLRTSLTAIRLSAAGFLVPYIFVYSPIMLGVGFSTVSMLHVVVTAVAGVVALGGALEGYLWREASRLERVLLVAAALTLIVPGLVTDVIGAALLLAAILSSRWRDRRALARASVDNLHESAALQGRHDRRS
ncbi:MAG: TRAP transporter fused permease subunit [Luteitalea sp.]|nr:TRAP transporter fused permease subunit [Luteitalea sp.]